MEENDLPNLISLSVFEFVLIMACSIIAISLFVYIMELFWDSLVVSSIPRRN